MFKTIPRFRPYNFISLKDAFFALLNDKEEIAKFEERFARYISTDHAIALSSATSGIYHILKSLGLFNSEVIIPAYTFWTVPNMAVLTGFRPVFIDIDDYYTLNPDLLKKTLTKRTRVILPTHMFGQPCEMDGIYDAIKDHDITIIEDCAPACGAEYKGRKVGGLGDFGIFSFNKFKNLTTFGGGIITTNDKKSAEKIRKQLTLLQNPSRKNILYKSFLNFAMKYFTNPYVFGSFIYPLVLALNYTNIDLIDKIFREKIKLLDHLPDKDKFTNFQAKIGLKHLRLLDEVNGKRIRNCRLFSEILADGSNIILPKERERTKHIFLNYPIKVKDKYYVADRLLSRSVDVRRNQVQVCSELDIFMRYSKLCPNASNLGKDLLDMPISPFLTKKEVHSIADILLNITK